ncbi:MAG: hypothetical protein ABWZ13_00015 [Acidimicrobiales bacterium]
MPDVDTTPLPNKTRVRVTSAMAGVPEGTAGSVQGTVGFALVRHRVAFDNGRFTTSVARDRLVLEDDWDEFVAAREQEAAAALEAAAAPPVEAPAEEKPAGDASPAVDDRLAALAARSKAAREKKAAEAG